MISLFAPLYKNNRNKLRKLISFIRNSKKLGYIRLSKTGEEIILGKTIFAFIFKPQFIDTREFLLDNLNLRKDIALNSDFNTFIQNVYSFYLLRKYDLSLNNNPIDSFINSIRRGGITKEGLIEELSRKLIKYVGNSKKATLLIERNYEIITMNDVSIYSTFKPDFIRVIFRDKDTLRAPPIKLVFKTLKNVAA